MPVIDVEQLKKIRGKRIKVSILEKLPPLPVQGESITPVGEAEYRLTLTNAGGTIAVEGTIRSELRVRCNRCLDQFIYPMETGFQEIYYDRNQPQPGGKETDWVPFTGDELDITPEMLQTIVVNLPMRFLCREDCRGLCPACGTELNNRQCECKHDDIDPRLAKLKDLLE